MYYFLSTALPFTKPEFYVWAFCVGFNITLLFVYILKSVESVFISKLFELGATNKESAVSVNDLSIKGKILLEFLLRDNATLRDVIFMVGVDDVEAVGTSDDSAEAVETGVGNIEAFGTGVESAVGTGDDAGIDCADTDNVDKADVSEVVEATETGVDTGDDTKKKKAPKVAIDFDTARFYINEEKSAKAVALKKGALKWFMLPIFCAISIGLAIGINYLIPIFQNW